MKIFEEVVTVKLRGSFTRPLDSSTRTSCTDMPAYLDEKHLSNLLGPTVSRSGQLQNLKREHEQEEGSCHDKPSGHYDPGPRGSWSSWGSEGLQGY